MCYRTLYIIPGFYKLYCLNILCSYRTAKQRRRNFICVQFRLVDFRLTPGGARLHTCQRVAGRGAPGGVRPPPPAPADRRAITGCLTA